MIHTVDKICNAEKATCLKSVSEHVFIIPLGSWFNVLDL